MLGVSIGGKGFVLAEGRTTIVTILPSSAERRTEIGHTLVVEGRVTPVVHFGVEAPVGALVKKVAVLHNGESSQQHRD